MVTGCVTDPDSRKHGLSTPAELSHTTIDSRGSKVAPAARRIRRSSLDALKGGGFYVSHPLVRARRRRVPVISNAPESGPGFRPRAPADHRAGRGPIHALRIDDSRW